MRTKIEVKGNREVEYEVDLKREDLVDAKRNFREQILDTIFPDCKDLWIKEHIERVGPGRWMKLEEIWDGHEKLGTMFQTQDGLCLQWRY